ncbi:MAG: hypothetical protein HY299_09570 [Verrucomicrobia bacterium]|nr:hypothetical protein [Verrucomicrobiota bacterium]
MKIVADKIDEYPRHALTRADVRLIFTAVPAAWSEGVKTVRLSASRSAAAVALYAGPVETFTIASRGCTKEQALHAVLAELAAHALGFKRRTFQHLQARYEAQVETLVAPLMRALLPQLARTIEPLS